MAEIAIRRLGPEELARVEPLYRGLRAHHRAVARVQVVGDPDLSWARRRAWYAEKAVGELLPWRFRAPVARESR